MTDEDVIDGIIAREGAGTYTNDAPDPPTRWGITLPTLQAWRGYPCTASDVEALERLEAVNIYTMRYLRDTHIDRISNGTLRAIVLDAAVNHGPAAAIKCLQRALGLDADGIIGNVTLAALPHLDATRVAVRVLSQRAILYAKTAAADPGNKLKYLVGWMNRLDELYRGIP